MVKSKLPPHSGPIKGGPKVLYIGVFQIAEGVGEGIGNFTGGIFLQVEGNLRRSDVDDSNLF